MNTGKLIFSSLLVVVLAACTQPSPEQRAEALCSEALKKAAKNPSSVEIPSVKAKAWGGFKPNGQYLVRWEHGDGLRLQNGFGAMMDATAICWVDPDGVFSLSINDKKVL